MQQPPSRQLYAYWDRIRNGRMAPRRFEIEPAKIASLLRETFIAECTGLLAFRFRLAGTKVCQHFGRELRGVDFLSLWSVHDRDAIGSLVRNIVNDGAVGHGVFLARTETNRQAVFEFTLLPLIHTGLSINRVLGSITARLPGDRRILERRIGGHAGEAPAAYRRRSGAPARHRCASPRPGLRDSVRRAPGSG